MMKAKIETRHRGKKDSLASDQNPHPLSIRKPQAAIPSSNQVSHALPPIDEWMAEESPTFLLDEAAMKEYLHGRGVDVNREATQFNQWMTGVRHTLMQIRSPETSDIPASYLAETEALFRPDGKITHPPTSLAPRM